jgi:hypothetical protein
MRKRGWGQLSGRKWQDAKRAWSRGGGKANAERRGMTTSRCNFVTDLCGYALADAFQTKYSRTCSGLAFLADAGVSFSRDS